MTDDEITRQDAAPGPGAPPRSAPTPEALALVADALTAAMDGLTIDGPIGKAFTSAGHAEYAALMAPAILAATPTPAACHGDDCLHCAWEAAEVAVLETGALYELRLRQTPGAWSEAVCWDRIVEESKASGVAATPQAALRALAARLTEGTR